MSTERRSLRQRGMTLIELIMFIVIVSVAVAGILTVMNLTTRHSADPMIRKQALAIAESLLEEIELQAFTWCDPQADPNASTVNQASECTVPQGTTPTAGQTRYTEPRFDNVGDYGGFTMNGIRDLSNTLIGGLENYQAAVGVTAETADKWRIDVTVTAPNAEAITLTGYRFRYAPRAVP